MVVAHLFYAVSPLILTLLPSHSAHPQPLSGVSRILTSFRRQAQVKGNAVRCCSRSCWDTLQEKLLSSHESAQEVLMRLAILSDIHGNPLALDAVLADIQRQGEVDAY